MSLSLRHKRKLPLGLVLTGSAVPLATAQTGPLESWGVQFPFIANLPSGEFRALSVPLGNFCIGIHADGTLVGWGSNEYGETTVPPGRFMAVAQGYRHGVGLRKDGTLVQWGAAPYGMQPPPGEFRAISSGLFFSVALRVTGELAAWGDDDYPSFHSYPGPVAGVPSGQFRAVAAGNWHAVAIRDDGTLASWGWNQGGALQVVPNGVFSDVAAGAYFSVGLRTDGTLVAWGYNLSGQLDVPGGTFTAVTAAASNGAAVRPDGTIAIWGTGSQPGGVLAPPLGRFWDVVLGESCAIGIRDVSCYPDCNGDGQRTIADFGCFVTRFTLADPYADCNGDGVLNLSDFGCFQTKFALGCP